MPRNTRNSGRPQDSGFRPQIVIGIVDTNYDDESELGRIKVTYPQLEGDPGSHWARLAAPDAGSNRGLYSVPENQDEVLVAFVGGDPTMPVVLGQLWNGKDKPPTEAKDGMPGSAKSTVPGAQFSTETFTDGSSTMENNDRRVWRSRSGHLFVFDDTDGKETIQMWDQTHTLSFAFDSAKKLITVANTEGDIHIRTKNDLYLEAGNDINWRAGNNIKGESGQETTHKAGTNYKTEAGMNSEHSAGQNYTIEASVSLSCKGSVSTSVEGGTTLEAKGGASAKLSSSGVAELTGGIVKIN